jgi:hypothetical protein
VSSRSHFTLRVGRDSGGRLPGAPAFTKPPTRRSPVASTSLSQVKFGTGSPPGERSIHHQSRIRKVSNCLPCQVVGERSIWCHAVFVRIIALRMVRSLRITRSARLSSACRPRGGATAPRMTRRRGLRQEPRERGPRYAPAGWARRGANFKALVQSRAGEFVQPLPRSFSGSTSGRPTFR